MNAYLATAILVPLVTVAVSAYVLISSRRDAAAIAKLERRSATPSKDGATISAQPSA